MKTGTAIALVAGLAVLGIGGYFLYQSSQKSNTPQTAAAPAAAQPPTHATNTNQSYDHTAEDWETGVKVGTSVVNATLGILDKLDVI